MDIIQNSLEGYNSSIAYLLLTNKKLLGRFFAPVIPGDNDNNGKINAIDFAMMKNKFPSYDIMYDFDGDMKATIADFTFLLKNWK